MDGYEHRFAELCGHVSEAGKDLCYPLGRVDILSSVKCYQKIFKRGHAECFHNAAVVDPVAEIVQNLFDRIAGNEYPVALDPLTHEVLFAAFRIWHEDGTRVVDDAAVYLLRHAVV